MAANRQRVSSPRPPLFGTYALYATGWDLNNVNEMDAIGPVTADGVGSLTGSFDVNSVSYGQGTGLPLSGAFAANTNGAFSGTITGLDVTTTTNQDAFSYYVVDSTKIFFIETDSNQPNVRILRAGTIIPAEHSGNHSGAPRCATIFCRWAQ